MPRLRAFIRAHGSSHAGIGRSPLALKPASMRPEGHGQEGTWTHPFATWGQPSTLMVPRKAREGCIPRRKAYGHGGRSIPANDGPAHRFGGSARACALMGSGISSEGSAIHEQAADVAVFATVIDGEGFSDPRARLLTSRSSPPSSTARAVPGHSTARAERKKGSKRARTDSSVQGETGTRSRARSS